MVYGAKSQGDGLSLPIAYPDTELFISRPFSDLGYSFLTVIFYSFLLEYISIIDSDFCFYSLNYETFSKSSSFVIDLFLKSLNISYDDF
jgi:hypothetical protein